MDVSRNEESHVSVTTSLFMALVKHETTHHFVSEILKKFLFKNLP